jgi:outer membrane murein-binding lipoprotein Lpp
MAENNSDRPGGRPEGAGRTAGKVAAEAEANAQANAYAMDRLSQAFENSARRWELIVYPSLFAFIILAAYGFYLVFSLAKDVHYLAISVDSNMTVLASNMQSISDNMGQISSNVRTMAVGVDSMAQDVSALEPMLTTMQGMDQSIQSMTFTTATMRDDLGLMNRNITRPMHFINTFMPW